MQISDEVDVPMSRLLVDIHRMVIIHSKPIFLNIEGYILEDELILISSKPSPVPVESRDILQ